MYKTKLLIDLYCDKVRKCKHKKNKTRLWCKIVP